MPAEPPAKDLVVLVADKNIEFAIEGLLQRPESLGTRPISFEVLPHPERDPGCLLRSPEFLRSFTHRYFHALVLFDREGCGRGRESRSSLEEDLESRLSDDWTERARAVVMDPELEAWFWSDSPHVAEALGWRDRDPDLRTWLEERGFLTSGSIKPSRPKEAVEAALREVRRPRSSAIYGRLASVVSFRRCTDPAFLKLLETLRLWFP